MTAIRGAIMWAVTAVLLAHATAYAQAANGAIRGQVLESNGLPAANVRVLALELPDAKGLSAMNPVSVGTTDAAGRYLFSDVPPGRYGVFSNIQSAYYLLAQDLNSTLVVVVQAGNDSLRDIVLPPPPQTPPQKFTVSGRVRRVPGSNDVEVFLSMEKSFRRTKVAVDGTFVFRNVSPGTYQIGKSGLGIAWGPGEVRVRDRDISGIELIPDESVSVTGRVTTEGRGPVPAFSFLLEGAQGITLISSRLPIDTLRSSGMVGTTGWTDRTDDVIVDTYLPFGEYRITVTGLPAGYRIKSFSYGSTNLLKNPINLKGVLDQLSIVLSPPESLHLVKISGRFIRDVPLPPEREREGVVLMNRELLTPLETVIAHDGTFELSNVPPGVYRVEAPAIGLRLAVSSTDVRGIELRTSRINSVWDRAQRVSFDPPPPVADVVDEIRTTEAPEPEAPVLPGPVKQVRVSGRLSGFRDAAILESIEVVLDGKEKFKSDPDRDGRFAFPAVPSGIYAISTNAYGSRGVDPSFARIVVVQDSDLEGIEVQVAARKKIIYGRIVVEGGGPLPRVALTIRPTVNVGPPFVYPYTLWSAPRWNDQFVVVSDGRFTLALPEGLHRLRVDGYTDYRVTSVTYGAANLKNDLLKIGVGKPKELVLTFSKSLDPFATTVKGKVEGMANAPPGVRVVLSGDRTGVQFEAVPNVDGTFEFETVPVDKYIVRLMPKLAATSTKTIVVQGVDVPSVNLTIPAQHGVALRIATDAGPPPSNVSMVLTLGPTEAYMVLLAASFVFRTANELVCVSDVCGPSTEGTIAGPAVASASRSDGRYTLRMPEGEYRVDVPAPAGYEVSSIVAGETDLRAAPLRVGPGAPQEIVVNLRRK